MKGHQNVFDLKCGHNLTNSAEGLTEVIFRIETNSDEYLRCCSLSRRAYTIPILSNKLSNANLLTSSRSRRHRPTYALLTISVTSSLSAMILNEKYFHVMQNQIFSSLQRLNVRHGISRYTILQRCQISRCRSAHFKFVFCGVVCRKVICK